MLVKKEMKKSFGTFFLILTFIFAVFAFTGSAFANENTTVVQVNILGYSDGGVTPDVSIEVPDKIDLGNVTKDNPKSKEEYVSINNTGRVNITVRPILKDEDEVIYNYLYFRTRKSADDPNLNIFYKIGDYSLKIKSPSTKPGSKTKEYCYVSLNMTDFDGTIKEDLIGYKSEIVFLAMPQ